MMGLNCFSKLFVIAFSVYNLAPKPNTYFTNQLQLMSLHSNNGNQGHVPESLYQEDENLVSVY